ncbi:MAG: hypothetical protein HY323_05525 [Betaproteobacteria bacterium]|nr:hypothetical protein [Betaproteobacteria bacterium]
MATLALLRSRVSKKIGLDETAAGAEEVLLDSWLNEAVEQVLLRSRCFVKKATITLTKDVNEYELDTVLSGGTLSVLKLINSDSVPLERVSPEEMADLRRSTASGTQAWKYALDGANLLMIWPTPTAAGTLTVYHVPRPTAMTTGANDPSTATYGGIPAEFHKLLEFYGLWQAADFDDDASSQVGTLYRAAFDRGLAEMRRALRQRGGRKLGPARLVSSKRRWLASDPSQTVPFD